MQTPPESQYTRRTQKNYSYQFKLQIIEELESGEISIADLCRKYGIQSGSTIRNWSEKYGNLDRKYQKAVIMEKSPEQRIMELEQRVKLLEQQKKQLEHQLERTDKKALFFDMMIDIAEEEFKLPIRKKSLSDLSKLSDSNKKKA